jgi:hypothetical protein
MVKQLGIVEPMFHLFEETKKQRNKETKKQRNKDFKHRKTPKNGYKDVLMWTAQTYKSFFRLPNLFEY